jgi:nitrate/nitrite transporter NarK
MMGARAVAATSEETPPPRRCHREVEAPGHAHGDSLHDGDAGRATKAPLRNHVDCLKDIRVVVMIFPYSACFGTELAMNARLASHFRTYLQMNSEDAAILAGCFVLMNLFP